MKKIHSSISEWQFSDRLSRSESLVEGLRVRDRKPARALNPSPSGVRQLRLCYLNQLPVKRRELRLRVNDTDSGSPRSSGHGGHRRPGLGWDTAGAAGSPNLVIVRLTSAAGRLVSFWRSPGQFLASWPIAASREADSIHEKNNSVLSKSNHWIFFSNVLLLFSNPSSTFLRTPYKFSLDTRP